MEISVSKIKVLKGISLSLLLTAASALVAVVIRPNLFVTAVGFLGLLMFGAMTIVFISRLFYTEPQVIINLEGVEDKRLNTGLIRWNEINTILMESAKQSQYLILDLNSPEEYYRKLPKLELFLRKANGQTGTNNFRIRFTDLDKPIDEAWEFIENNILKTQEESLHLAP